MSDAMNQRFAALARNNRWANHRLHAACAALGQAAFLAPRPGFFPSLARTLNHVLAVDLYYLDALEGGGAGPRAFRDAPRFDAPAPLAAAQAATDQRLIRFCDALTPQAAAGSVATDRGAAGVARERVADVLLHLFLHQTHHRGQAHAMLSHAGAVPPQLDEFFLDFDRAPDIADALAVGAAVNSSTRTPAP